jgi:DeoD family purine-nucleoside phosphorylase
MTIHIQPKTELAERALLPGDPGRALAVAQLVLERPLMFNHNRGLWGYTGIASDGQPLTIQSTGMGGPSAAIVVSELIDLGLRRAIRIGTCGALGAHLRLGDLVIADAALCGDGTSRALGADDRVEPDPQLTGALRAAAPQAHSGTIVSTDLFYGSDLHAPGALAVEMEAATLFALGAARGVQVACLLAVSDIVRGEGRERIDEDGLIAAGERLGSVGTSALRA